MLQRKNSNRLLNKVIDEFSKCQIPIEKRELPSKYKSIKYLENVSRII